jgi:hypothetical protein
VVVLAAAAVTVEAEAVIAPAPQLERQSFAQAAASRLRFLLNLVEIVRCFAATASRRKRAVRAAAVADVDVAATTAADAAAVAADATNFRKTNFKNSKGRNSIEFRPLLFFFQCLQDEKTRSFLPPDRGAQDPPELTKA